MSMPLLRPFETSLHLERDRECVLIRAESDGLEGWGECVAHSIPWYSYESIGTAWHVLHDFLVPAVLDHELTHPSELIELVSRIKGHPMAKAGLELALWDLFGRAGHHSLTAMLGGERSAVEVGVSIGIQEDAETLLNLIEQHLAEGYGRIKLKIKPGRDLKDVQVVREAHPELPLQVDANTAYERGQFEVFERMDQFALTLIEQPYATEDLEAHAELQARLETPVCLDESIDSAVMARQAMSMDACRIINIKPGRVGGLTEAVAIHDLCAERGVPVWCGGMLETGVGRAANLALSALPGFKLPGDISATDRYYEVDIASPRFELNGDGTIDVPTGPGLGVQVDPAALDRFTLRSERYAT